MTEILHYLLRGLQSFVALHLVGRILLPTEFCRGAIIFSCRERRPRRSELTIMQICGTSRATFPTKSTDPIIGSVGPKIGPTESNIL